ncbi:cation transporter [Ruegeria sp. HKCCA5763]|uniref:cation transporter n=1 Tax=Ruegeria sp. HKCCA5763 TaxID=2682987 RepID=UPI001480EA44|nr:cation transporter [Ruegeria sp. HKCCA5763]
MQNEHASEQRALTISMIGTLLMGLAGIGAAILSNSQAILLDGLFSFVGFAAALFARRVIGRVQKAPDQIRPFGYGSEESIFTTFRALSLLGVVLFAIINALRSIGSYANGQLPPPLLFEPIAVYLAAILMTCLVLWLFHQRAWRKGGKRSDILKLEANAAAFDGAVTAAAGVGLFLVASIDDGPLAVVAPIGDSLIVLVLCSMAAIRYFADFRAGLAELAGVAAPKASYEMVLGVVKEPIASFGGKLVELLIVKAGRSHSIVVLFDPQRPVSAIEIDTLSDELEQSLRQKLKHANILTVVTSSSGDSETH